VSDVRVSSTVTGCIFTVQFITLLGKLSGASPLDNNPFARVCRRIWISQSAHGSNFLFVRVSSALAVPVAYFGFVARARQTRNKKGFVLGFRYPGRHFACPGLLSCRPSGTSKGGSDNDRKSHGLDFLLVRIFVTVGGAFAVNAFGAWVGEGVFDAFEMGGILAKFGGVAAKFLTEFGQATVDDGAGGTAFAGDLAGAEAVHAVEAKDGVEADFARALAAIQCLDGRECLPGGIVVLRLFWLGGEFGEEFAGGGAGVEGAMVGEGEVGVEGEQFGGEVGQEFLAGGVEVFGWWGRGG